MNAMPPHHQPPLRTKDLFELASLDALGILDEQERRAFEEAFAAAPPALRAQLRAQQDLMADIAQTLPDAEPPASLRARVLAAVQGAISATRLHEAGRTTPAILPSRGVSRVWRAAAIGFAAAAVVFGISTVQMRLQYRELDQAFTTNAATEMFIREFGPRFESLLMAPHTQVVKFAAGQNPAAGATPGMAVLILDPQTKSGQFLAKDLPENGGSYSLVVVGPDGQVGKAVLTFKPSGTRIAAEVQDLDVPGGSVLAVRSLGNTSAAQAKTLLKSQSL